MENTNRDFYKKVDPAVQEAILEMQQKKAESLYKCPNNKAIRRDNSKDKPNLWRPAFVRDIEKIIHLPVYNRLADKTQVFSFYKNDDLTRRALHVQLVSRIARSIGAVLGLNTDLIESIALGHDIGHPPFGHVGEHILSKLLQNETGNFFNHNVHSVRVLDSIFRRNISLQTLDGILCHNGEFEMQEYRPNFISDSSFQGDFQQNAEELFRIFDEKIKDCDNFGDKSIKKLVPNTLEACVVRICDMIAYLGKDRQDAITAKIIQSEDDFETREIGTFNAAIINNLTVDIINNSFGKDYLLLSPSFFADLKNTKKENYEKIYHNPKLSKEYDDCLLPMFTKLYYKLLNDVQKQDCQSVIYKHHIDFVEEQTKWYTKNCPEKSCLYRNTEPNRLVTDFIASMSDDYFIDLHAYFFPNSKYKINYKSYFC